MHGNVQGGARFANSAGGGTADALQWVGGGFRKNGVAGLILDNGAHDMYRPGRLFRGELRRRHPRHLGHHPGRAERLREQRRRRRLGRRLLDLPRRSPSRPTARRRSASAATSTAARSSLIGSGNEYYGGGIDPTALANLQGSGTLSIAGGGKVIAGPGISVTGGSAVSTGATTTTRRATPWLPRSDHRGLGHGHLGRRPAISMPATSSPLTVTFSEAVTVSGGTPTLVLNDGGTATYSSGSGSDDADLQPHRAGRPERRRSRGDGTRPERRHPQGRGRQRRRPVGGGEQQSRRHAAHRHDCAHRRLDRRLRFRHHAAGGGTIGAGSDRHLHGQR